jgi:hypothetical protein
MDFEGQSKSIQLMELQVVEKIIMKALTHWPIFSLLVSAVILTLSFM